MIYFYDRLYVHEQLKNPSLVKRRLRRHARKSFVWVLCPAADRKGLEILHSVFLPEHGDILIVGLAGTKQDAVDLYAQILEETLAATGGCDVAGYLFPEGIPEEFSFESLRKSVR